MKVIHLSRNTTSQNITLDRDRRTVRSFSVKDRLMDEERRKERMRKTVMRQCRRQKDSPSWRASLNGCSPLISQKRWRKRQNRGINGSPFGSVYRPYAY